jgi:lipopolysaccharide transport system permease protein
MTDSASQPVDQRDVPVVVIRPSKGLRALDLKELVRSRELLLSLAVRDVKLRYRQTALGGAWIIVQPLLAAGVFSFVFGNVADLPSDGVPYFVFAFAGMLGWNVYAGTLGKSSSSLLANAALVSKVYFPRLVLPLSSALSVVIDFVVASGVMAVILVVTDLSPGPAVALLPIWIVALLGLALGTGLTTSALAVRWRDFAYIVPVLAQFLLYVSPVAYALDAIPARFRTLYSMNPLVGLLEAVRWSVLGTNRPGWPLIWSLACAVVVFLVGVIAFRQSERRFADFI